jgi:hypothetical protein
MTTAQPYAYLIPYGIYKIFVVLGLHHQKWYVAADEINGKVWLTKDGHWVSMGRNSDRDEEDYERVLFDTADEAIAAAVKKSDEGTESFFWYPDMETYRERTKKQRGGDPA